MERYADKDKLIVGSTRGAGSVILLIAIIVIVIILIIIVVIIARNSSSTNTSTGSGNLECVNDIDCVGDNVCDTSRGVCTECLLDGDCPFSRPLCDQTSNTCVACVDSGDCVGTNSICSNSTKTCVQCLQNGDCGGATPLCNPSTNQCVGCLNNGNCPMSSPLCNQSNNQCVECLTNANCIFPATCLSGQCCDATAPIIITLSGSIPAGGPSQINGTYAAGQPLAGLTAIYEVSDSTGFVLLNTPGVPADGNISIFEPPVMYTGYDYQVRVRLLASCGSTLFSAPVMITMPPPSGLYDTPVIFDGSGSMGGFQVRLSNPPGGLTFLYSNVKVFISTTPTLEPNRADLGGPIFVSADGVYIKIISSWPFPVNIGDTYYIRVSGVLAANINDVYVLSAPIAITVV